MSILEQYARAQVTEGNAAAQLCRGDRLAFREAFTQWCLENPALATKG